MLFWLSAFILGFAAGVIATVVVCDGPTEERWMRD